MFVLAASLALAPAIALGQWNENGKPMPDTAWAKSAGGFGAQLFFTDAPDALFAAWAVPGPLVQTTDVERIARGKPIVGVIIFAGCAADAAGNCNAIVTYSIRGPDGKAYGETLPTELWQGKPGPPTGQVQLAVGNIGVVIEPEDLLGTYTVRAEITDTVSGKAMVLERAFTAHEAEPAMPK
ncbi:MAG: hypothetical protein ACREO3_10720 [Arenimonas sp.]